MTSKVRKPPEGIKVHACDKMPEGEWDLLKPGTVCQWCGWTHADTTQTETESSACLSWAKKNGRVGDQAIISTWIEACDWQRKQDLPDGPEGWEPASSAPTVSLTKAALDLIEHTRMPADSSDTSSQESIWVRRLAAALDAPTDDAAVVAHVDRQVERVKAAQAYAEREYQDADDRSIAYLAYIDGNRAAQAPTATQDFKTWAERTYGTSLAKIWDASGLRFDGRDLAEAWEAGIRSCIAAGAPTAEQPCLCSVSVICGKHQGDVLKGIQELKAKQAPAVARNVDGGECPEGECYANAYFEGAGEWEQRALDAEKDAKRLRALVKDCFDYLASLEEGVPPGAPHIERFEQALGMGDWPKPACVSRPDYCPKHVRVMERPILKDECNECKEEGK